MTKNDSFVELETDRHEIAYELGRRAEQELRAAPEARLGQAMVRGVLLRRRRRSVIAAVAAITLALTVLAGPRIGEALQSSSVDSRPAGIEKDEVLAHAATFGLRAMAHTGLLNSGEDFHDYRSTESLGGSWRVLFAARGCYLVARSEGCRYDTSLEITIEDDEWVVAAVEGPMDDDARSRLLSYRAPAEPLAPHPEFAPVVLSEPEDVAAQGGGLDVTVTMYWAGPIPERRMTFACRLEAYDDEGRTIYEGQARAYVSPTSEERREGGMLGTALPLGVDAERATMLCEPFAGPGWELEEQPSITPVSGGRAVRIRGQVVWRQPAISGLDTACGLRVLDGNGNVVGEVDFPMAAPWTPDEEPPVTRPLEHVIDVEEGATAESASFSCSVPKPLVGEQEDDEGEEDGDGGGGGGTRPDPVSPDDRPAPPDGPPHVLASGTFEGAAWGKYDGLEWALQVWADDSYRCFRFGVGAELQGERAGLCTYLPDEDPHGDVGGRGSVPAAGFDGALTIAYGEVSERVARVRFELSSGQVTEVETLVPPPDIGVDARYYMAFLEPSESFEIVVLDDEGGVLEQD